MNKIILLGASLLALSLLLSACQPPAQQQPAPGQTTATAPAAQPASPPGVGDLVGARAAGGESTMEARGYSVARTQGLTAYWWHTAGSCVRVVTANGRYSVVERTAASNCGR
ncbi:MAG: hypothetical protein MUC89_16910 [Acetobacteraceae bacterium]|jgi:hypothetical protein|nr:hypothetical protein [Acetobacteraceae bacterium]